EYKMRQLTPAGTQDADSDSECDEQVIIIPSYPSHSLQEELARLKGQVKRATSDAKDAEELQKRASTNTVPPGSIPVPTGCIQIPSVPAGKVIIIVSPGRINLVPTSRILSPGRVK
ncbi:hypothetical protein Tco_1052428, partial [Tanacetum coccineum]